jgi:alpha-D-ribose 1-methylphosphonate 5-triphosphate synthase subunit PhnH
MTIAPPAPTQDEAVALAAFEAIMRAMAEPGRSFELPEPGPACIARALIDREVRAHAADSSFVKVLAALDARLAPIETADYVFAPATPDLPARLHGGTLTYPEAGATLITPIRLGTGPAVRLTGPGIETAREVRVGLEPAFWAARKAALRYPLGFDLILHDGAAVLAVPRSTLVEAC